MNVSQVCTAMCQAHTLALSLGMCMPNTDTELEYADARPGNRTRQPEHAQSLSMLVHSNEKARTKESLAGLTWGKSVLLHDFLHVVEGFKGPCRLLECLQVGAHMLHHRRPRGQQLRWRPLPLLPGWRLLCGT